MCQNICFETNETSSDKCITSVRYSKRLETMLNYSNFSREYFPEWTQDKGKQVHI